MDDIKLLVTAVIVFLRRTMRHIWAKQLILSAAHYQAHRNVSYSVNCWWYLLTDCHIATFFVLIIFPSFSLRVDWKMSTGKHCEIYASGIGLSKIRFFVLSCNVKSFLPDSQPCSPSIPHSIIDLQQTFEISLIALLVEVFVLKFKLAVSLFECLCVGPTM